MCGWFDREAAQRDHATKPRVVRDPAGNATFDGPAFFIRLQSNQGTVHIAERAVTAVIGEPCDEGLRILAPEDVARLASDGRADASWNRLRGRFSIVHIDLQQGKATLLTDRFAVIPLCWSIEGSRIAFSDRADGVPLAGQREIDPQSIFNYVYFHVIPAPRTIFRGVQRMEPATRLSFDARGLHSSSIWRPAPIAKEQFKVKVEQERFRTLFRQAIEREVTTPRIGAFLSGGTDSSTVVGLMGRVTGKSVNSFSIGFDAERIR